MNRFEEMDIMEIILAVEEDGLMPENIEEAKTVLDAVSDLRYSQGFYSRLCTELEEYIAENDDGKSWWEK